MAACAVFGAAKVLIEVFPLSEMNPGQEQIDRQPCYQPRLHVVLFQPEIPPNTGAIGRTCVAAGAKLWLVRPLGFQVDQKTLRRAGLDYWKFLEWEVVDNWDALTKRLDQQRMWFFTKTATRRYTDPKFQEGDVFVFGRETSGLPEELLKNGDRNLRIPIRPEVRSLNLSCSVGISVFEADRQFFAGQ